MHFFLFDSNKFFLRIYLRSPFYILISFVESVCSILFHLFESKFMFPAFLLVMSEAATGDVLQEKVFLEISQNSGLQL